MIVAMYTQLFFITTALRLILFTLCLHPVIAAMYELQDWAICRDDNNDDGTIFCYGHLQGAQTNEADWGSDRNCLCIVSSPVLVVVISQSTTVHDENRKAELSDRIIVNPRAQRNVRRIV